MKKKFSFSPIAVILSVYVSAVIPISGFCLGVPTINNQGRETVIMSEGKKHRKYCLKGDELKAPIQFVCGSCGMELLSGNHNNHECPWCLYKAELEYVAIERPDVIHELRNALLGTELHFINNESRAIMRAMNEITALRMELKALKNEKE